MSVFAIIFTLIAAAAILAAPRRWAAMPFLVAACYMTMGQKIDLGLFSLHMVRLLIAAGVARVVIRREWVVGGLNGLDKIMLVWAAWALTSSAFHEVTSEGNPLVFRMGLVYNVLGIYFLMRIFVQSLEDVVRVVKVTACLFIPVALEMIQEQITRHNLFAIFGGVGENVIVRNERLRAQGPFMHPILAGTVGAVCFPYMVGLYRKHAAIAGAGAAACLVMVVASGSSGPLMSLIFGVFALTLWRWRHLTRQMRLAVVFGYIFLDIVMKAPAYYLIARIDLTGSSTGWHRAYLIESGLAHLSEWWFAGTDYTRHWMPTGVSWSPEHTDITNHYLQYGVIGGLPLMLIFMTALGVAFCYVGRCLRAAAEAPWEEQFFIWSVGAALLGQAATCISVAYFDQSYVFLFLNMALISSMWAARLSEESVLEEDLDNERSDVLEPTHGTAIWR